MPRTGRFTVEFVAGDHNWLAEFTHRHATAECPHIIKKDGKVVGRLHAISQRKELPHLQICPSPVYKPAIYIDPADEKRRKHEVLHVTTVRLRYKDGGVKANSYAQGEAPCSFDDEYKWRKGIHIAMQRALEKAGLCKLDKVDATKCIGDCPHARFGAGHEHSPVCIRDSRIVVVDKKPLYREVMESFWRESRIPAPPLRRVAAAVIPPVSPGPEPERQSSRAMLAAPATEYTGKLHGMGFTGD